MLIFVILLLIILIFAKTSVLASLISFKKLYDWSKAIPGPPFLALFRNKKTIIEFLEDLEKQYGSIFKIWFGKDLTVFVLDPDDVKTVLSNNSLLYKSNNYNLVQVWLGRGLLTNGGADWHLKRKLLTPAFHFKILSTFKGQMEDNCDILVNKLFKVADGRTFDIYPFITLFALDVISETAMGIKKNAQIHEDSKFVLTTKLLCGLFHKQLFSIWKRIKFLYMLTNEKVQRDEAINYLHGETNKIIELRRKMLNDLNINAVPSTDETGIKRRLAFLDMLLLMQKEGMALTNQNIQEEVDTFIFEGHDTTSSALAFAIYELSLNQDIQSKVYEEANEFIGKEAETMKYLEAVIKETLRLYPSVPTFSRLAKEPLALKSVTIQPGATITINTYLLHRNAKHFKNPLKFDPQRFLTDEQLHPFVHVPFSAGPRNCIGQKFAMLELKCTLSKLVRSFEILPAAKDGYKPQLVPALILTSVNGVQVRLKKRNEKF